MNLIKAEEHDLQELYSLYERVSDRMLEEGLVQWRWGVYPTEDMIRTDVERGEMYVLRMDGRLSAAVALTKNADQEYLGVPWTFGSLPGYFHRLAVDPGLQGGGLGGDVLDDAIQILRRSGCDCVRCDTNVTNTRARRLYERMGFRACGPVIWDDTPGESYLAFDKPLKRETPLWPIRMIPAFRGGALTPWGGDRLREEYGKQTAEETTGESLEVSCIPGLESRDGTGRTLPELILEFGEKLVGKYADRPFPLLLKLIDARKPLSVQVHPDDVYAALHENGKLGKTEAWLILEAPEGAELVYGLMPGTGAVQLAEACKAGKAVEKLLRKVRVAPGDVCYIPAGCVHAIGAGIVLYEIQESSDVTYRFYDWDRTDAEGRKRELHLTQALAVTNLKCAPMPVKAAESSGTKRLLKERMFTLDIVVPDGVEKLPPVQHFGMLTVLRGEMELIWPGGDMTLKKGETCFLPANAPDLYLRGEGAAAVSMPNN